MISNFLAFMVPDIPASVQREIKKERLLAYEALQSRLASKNPSKPRYDDDGDGDGDDL